MNYINQQDGPLTSQPLLEFFQAQNDPASKEA